MFYHCDIHMISYFTMFTGQVMQEFGAYNMINLLIKFRGGNRGDGLSEKTLCICSIRQ